MLSGQKVLLGLSACALFGIDLAAAPARGQTLDTVRVASGLNRPIYATAPPGDTTRLFFLEKRGLIRILDLTVEPPVVLGTNFLNIDSLVVNIGSNNDERGLLGLAFDPDYATNGFFYVNYINNSSNTVIARYTVSADPNVANAASAVTLFTVTQPNANHNGGSLHFGPDGFLYAALGDGGGGCDIQTTGNPPVVIDENNAQDTSTLLGKMLRLDVDNPPTYVAAGNPFIGAGNPLDQIWSVGLRNPWQFSFDQLNGDLYIADVGQNQREEINYRAGGGSGAENYGWRCCEGLNDSNISLCPDSAGCAFITNCAQATGAYVPPIHTYTHATGLSITGGVVYRGSAICGLQGTYFFADYASAQIFSMVVVGGTVTQLTNRTADLAPGGGLSIGTIAAFGQDGAGEVYIVDQGGTSAGEIYKIVPGSGALVNVATAVPADETLDPLDDQSAGQPQGLSQFEITFASSTALCAGQISIECNGGTACPTVASVAGSGAGPYTVTLSGPIPPGYCTRFTFANANAGDSNPLTYRFMPGDASGNLTTNTQDLLALIQAINAGAPPVELFDVNRSGVVNTQDLLRIVQLLNGVDSTQPWNGVSLVCP